MKSQKPRSLKIARGPFVLVSGLAALNGRVLAEVSWGVKGGAGRSSALSCAEVATMTELWRKESDGFAVHFTPVLRDAFFLRGFDREDNKDALVSSTGEYLWQADLGSGTCWRDQVLDWREPIVVRDGLTLSELRRVDLGTPIDNRNVCGDLLIHSMGLQGPWKGLDLVSGRPVWEQARPSAELVLNPTDWSESLFVAREDRTLAMFSKEDGRELWRKGIFTGGRARSTGGRVIVLARKLDDSAIGLSATKYLMCFDSQTGEPIYERLLRAPEEEFSPAWTSYPAVGKEHIVFAERSGLLGAFRMSDGELAWSYKYKAQLYDPCIVDNSVAVASADGNLLLFDSILPVL